MNNRFAISANPFANRQTSGGPYEVFAWCLFGVGFWRAPGKDLFAGSPTYPTFPKPDFWTGIVSECSLSGKSLPHGYRLGGSWG